MDYETRYYRFEFDESPDLGEKLGALEKDLKVLFGLWQPILSDNWRHLFEYSGKAPNLSVVGSFLSRHGLSGRYWITSEEYSWKEGYYGDDERNDLNVWEFGPAVTDPRARATRAQSDSQKKKLQEQALLLAALVRGIERGEHKTQEGLAALSSLVGFSVGGSREADFFQAFEDALLAEDLQTSGV
jgi:hypothetical protein